MIAYAERLHILSAVDKDGVSERETLEGLRERAAKAARRGDAAAQKRLAEFEEDLRMPPFPEALRYLWTAFLTLRRRVSPSMGGPAVISLPDIMAYCQLYRIRLAPWEVETLTMLDDVMSRPPTNAGGDEEKYDNE